MAVDFCVLAHVTEFWRSLKSMPLWCKFLGHFLICIHWLGGTPFCKEKLKAKHWMHCLFMRQFIPIGYHFHILIIFQELTDFLQVAWPSPWSKINSGWHVFCKSFKKAFALTCKYAVACDHLVSEMRSINWWSRNPTIPTANPIMPIINQRSQSSLCKT